MNALSFRLLLAIILSLALTILPLPDILIGIRPAWVLLLVLYMQYFLADYFNIRLLLVLGLILDVLLATVIGEHAFAMALAAWLASTKARRFIFFSIGQQMALIGLFCLLYQFTIAIIDTVLGHSVRFYTPLASAAISMLLWPWIRLIAHDTLYMLPHNRDLIN